MLDVWTRLQILLMVVGLVNRWQKLLQAPNQITVRRLTERLTSY